MVNLRSRYLAKEIEGKAGLLAILELQEVDYWAITPGQAAVGKIEFHLGIHQNVRIQQLNVSPDCTLYETNLDGSYSSGLFAGGICCGMGV